MIIVPKTLELNGVIFDGEEDLFPALFYTSFDTLKENELCVISVFAIDKIPGFIGEYYGVRWQNELYISRFSFYHDNHTDQIIKYTKELGAYDALVFMEL